MRRAPPRQRVRNKRFVSELSASEVMRQNNEESEGLLQRVTRQNLIALVSELAHLGSQNLRAKIQIAN